MPKVVIGVPVYNGASLIKECLESLANQDFADFSVLISDNASDDGTTSICAEFCARDRRFKHIIREQTVSANENFLSLLAIADCDYFAFRAYDDLASRDWLKSLFELLEGSTSARLAVSNVLQTFGPGKKSTLFRYPARLSGADSGATATKITQMFSGHTSWFYGLWKTTSLRESYHGVMDLYSDPWGSDHLIILHAILSGGVVGTSGDARFVQRVLPVERHYIKRERPGYTEMSDRNRRFHEAAKVILSNCWPGQQDSRLVRALLPLYTLHRCHGPRRLLQAKAKSLLKAPHK